MNTKEILEQRGSRYGAFKDNAQVAQYLKGIIREHIPPSTDHDMMEGLDQICSKISRIVTGDPTHIDNWDDIAGYATLVANRLRGVPSEASPGRFPGKDEEPLDPGIINAAKEFWEKKPDEAELTRYLYEWNLPSSQVKRYVELVV